MEINLKGVITWRISVRAAISARLAGLRFQSGFWRKSSWNESSDYMEKTSVRAENRAEFSARANGLKNPHEVHVIEMKCQPGLKRQREHAQWGCFLGNKVAARVEIFHVIATIFQPAPQGHVITPWTNNLLCFQNNVIVTSRKQRRYLSAILKQIVFYRSVDKI